MQLVLPLLFGGNVLGVEPINVIYGGSRSQVVFNETTIVICLLSSKPSTCTCLVPFDSQILSPPLGTKWTLVWSLFTTNASWTKYAFTK